MELELGNAAAFSEFNEDSKTIFIGEGATNEGHIGDYFIEVKLNGTEYSKLTYNFTLSVINDFNQSASIPPELVDFESIAKLDIEEILDLTKDWFLKQTYMANAKDPLTSTASHVS